MLYTYIRYHFGRCRGGYYPATGSVAATYLSPDFPVMAADPAAGVIMDDGLGNEESDEEDEEEDEEVILNEGGVDGMIVDAEQRAEDLIDWVFFLRVLF